MPIEAWQSGQLKRLIGVADIPQAQKQKQSLSICQRWKHPPLPEVRYQERLLLTVAMDKIQSDSDRDLIIVAPWTHSKTAQSQTALKVSLKVLVKTIIQQKRI